MYVSRYKYVFVLGEFWMSICVDILIFTSQYVFVSLDLYR